MRGVAFTPTTGKINRTLQHRSVTTLLGRALHDSSFLFSRAEIGPFRKVSIQKRKCSLKHGNLRHVSKNENLEIKLPFQKSRFPQHVRSFHSTPISLQEDEKLGNDQSKPSALQVDSLEAKITLAEKSAAQSRKEMKGTRKNWEETEVKLQTLLTHFGPLAQLEILKMSEDGIGGGKDSDGWSELRKLADDKSLEIHIPTLVGYLMNIAQQKALHSDAKNRYITESQALQQLRELQLEKTRSRDGTFLERPLYFSTVGMEQEAQKAVDSAWNSYLKGDPTIDEPRSEWLRTIRMSDVKHHGIVSLNLDSELVEGSQSDGKPEPFQWTSLLDQFPKVTANSRRSKPIISILQVVWDSEKLTTEEKELMGTCLHIVVLPTPIFHSKSYGGSQIEDRILFFRNVDVALMAQWSELSDSVLIGAPGISKSWHLWKYLVCAINPEVWKNVGKGVPRAGKQRNTRVRGLLAPEAVVFHDYFGVHTFFLKDGIVHFNVDGRSVAALGRVPAPSDTLKGMLLQSMNLNEARLPEVGSLSKVSVCSTDDPRYDKLMKQNRAIDLYFPCPTHAEVLTMTNVLSGIPNRLGFFHGSQKNVISTVMERALEMGPFPRTLYLDDIAYAKCVKLQKNAVRGLDKETLSTLVEPFETFDIENRGVSYGLVKFHTPEASIGDFRVFKLLPSSARLLEMLQDHLDSFELKKFNEILRSQEPIEGRLKFVLSKYLQRGLKWGYQNQGEHKPEENNVGHFPSKPRVKRLPPVAVAQMKSDVLYVPSRGSFPFVDMLWVEKDGGLEDGRTNRRVVYAIRCDGAEPSAKNEAEYLSLMKDHLALDIGRDKLVVHIASLPSHVNSMIHAASSDFWDGPVPETPPELRVLLPHKHFENESAETDDYKVVARITKRKGMRAGRPRRARGRTTKAKAAKDTEKAKREDGTGLQDDDVLRTINSSGLVERNNVLTVDKMKEFLVAVEVGFRSKMLRADLKVLVERWRRKNDFGDRSSLFSSKRERSSKNESGNSTESEEDENDDDG